MPNGDFQGGEGGVSVAGLSRDLSELHPDELVAVSVGVAKPPWMITRFPVSVEEFRELSEAAQEPDPASLSPADDTVTEDSSTEAAEEPPEDLVDPFADVPEDAPNGVGVAQPGTAAPTTAASFVTTPQTGFTPPDCSLAVGSQDVLVAVNVDLAAYRKDGSLRFRWPSMTALFGSALPAGAGLFDPKLIYDHYAQRWVAVVAARRSSPAGSWLMLAASQGPNPGGVWWVWALDATVDGSNPSGNWSDYPMVGFDTQAIYITTNQFQMGGGFSYAKMRILNKTEIYAGAALRWWDFWNLHDTDGSQSFTVQSAMHFRGTGGNPPAYFCNAVWPGGSHLTLWQLNDSLALWRGGSPALTRASVPCRSYALPPDAEQPTTATRLETNDARLLSGVFQYVGGVQRFWTAHTTKVTWSGESVARSGIQWYEIDVVSKSVVQQGVFGATGFYYFFPVVQTDIARNAHLCFTRSNDREFGSMRQTGRRSTDAPNTLQGSALLKAGQSAYTGGRWGDYFGHARDGGDAGLVWLCGEFADARNAWGTWVGSTRF
jgi:hypothetical protein